MKAKRALLLLCVMVCLSGCSLLMGQPPVDDDARIPPTPMLLDDSPAQDALPDDDLVVDPDLPICTQVKEIPESECSALETLFNATGGPTWVNREGWLETLTPCTWRGIACEDGHVTELRIPDNGLTGEIPAAITDLTELWAFSVRNNAVTGIPGELGQMAYLNQLVLRDTALTALPEGLCDSPSLEYLDVRGNQLAVLPENFSKLQSLKTLHLVDSGLTEVPAVVWELDSLEVLTLGGANFSAVADKFTELPDLKSLNLVEMLGLDFPESVGTLSKLESLTLRRVGLTEIPPEIYGLTNLTVLQLNNNNISTIPADIARLSQLRDLDLRNNAFVEVPDALASLSNLVSLNLAGNAALAGAVPEWITTLPALETLDLTDSGLCVPDTGAVADFVNSLSTFTPSGVMCTAADLLPPLPPMPELVLTPTSEAVCAAVTTLPVAECHALVSLYEATGGDTWAKRRGWLSGDDPCTWFGVRCSDDGQVRQLKLSSNGLMGAIPAEIMYLQDLRVLELGVDQARIDDGGQPNAITALPEELGYLTYLRALDVGYNWLGDLPDNFVYLVNLEVLDLSANALDSIGPIATLTKLTHFSFFFTNQTQFPEGMWTLTQLESLDFSTNPITQIPEELGNLTNLRELYMADIALTLPASLANLRELVVLDMTGMELKALPDGLANLDQLQVLRIGHNAFRSLPEELAALTNLNELSLTGCINLTGPLPAYLTGLQQLQTLDLVNTDMCAPADADITTWLDSIDVVYGDLPACE